MLIWQKQPAKDQLLVFLHRTLPATTWPLPVDSHYWCWNVTFAPLLIAFFYNILLANHLFFFNNLLKFSVKFLKLLNMEIFKQK